MHTIFVTAVGAISVAGSGSEEYWRGINEPSGIPPNQIKLPLDIPQNIDNKSARRMDRFSRLTLSASKQVLDDELIEREKMDRTRIGTVFTTGYGPVTSNLTLSNQIVSGGVDTVSPTVFASTLYNSGIGHTCMNLKLKGASTILMGSNAIAYAADLLKSGKADAVLCGGVEEYCPELYEAFQQQDYVTKDEHYLCRPLDENRSGARMTEGVAALLLETESVLSRSPERILCEVAGYASLTGSNNPGAEVGDKEAFEQVMGLALMNASLSPDDIDGILMAAGGGQLADRVEAQAIHEVFGPRSASIPVTSIKGAVGEVLGASFSLNVAAGALAITKGCLPLTAGCITPDPALELEIVHQQPRPGCYRYLLVNGHDVSGCLHSVVLASYAGVNH
ncbi:beta-ketoacyl synthase N-terminal-like domain-containing protein [Paenibacillus sp. GCM10012307]|uniref:Beta-ketoacyl synthase chain length factor n=1 Tax=Paenibacillus roseus TaxID=2798579 RepID=A0A934MRC2_9BACL|nr:beta-ketoacyl synthase N-terminal-like domain-containing protein [Paenibacillus roseus]MBJ6364106.1 beta-ketoacyl synthase chain length factor [Paenibacillus roseus]